MDPRYRFTQVMSILLIASWLLVVISTYLFGERGLNWERYTQGVIIIGTCSLGGFFLVWLSTQILAWQQRKKTGFEASVVDEFGTAFEMLDGDGKPMPFKLALSKFNPLMVAPPFRDDLHPLEQDLIGFLNGYRHWPLNLNHPDLTVYERAMARWHIMRQIPHAHTWHYALALSYDLSALAAYKDIRIVAPWWQFWMRDRIRFEHKCTPGGGMSAFILSTMPSFRELASTLEGRHLQRVMLTVLRYAHTPHLMPINAGPHAEHMMETLQRAEAHLMIMNVDDYDKLPLEKHAELVREIHDLWMNMLTGFQPANAFYSDTGEPCALFKATDEHGQPEYWLAINPMLERMSKLLSFPFRHILNLWDTPHTAPLTHPAWSHIHAILTEHNLILKTHHGVQAILGSFTLDSRPHHPMYPSWGPAVKLSLDIERHAPIIKLWHSLPAAPPPELHLDIAQTQARATQLMTAFDQRLTERFG